jgi:hypothetical protein
LGNVVGTLIFIWVALYQQRWLVLITIPIYAFIVCAARYSIFVVDGEYGSYQSLTLSFSGEWRQRVRGAWRQSLQSY